MASKRYFKKHLNKAIFDTVEECFVVQMHEPEKKEITDKLVHEIVEFRNEIRSKINTAKSSSDFKPIYSEAQEKVNAFVDRVNGL